MTKVERLGPESLGDAISNEACLIIWFGMYGCAPCQLFEDRCDEALRDVSDQIRIKYVKLRPSQFRELQDRSVIDSVPVAISFRRGKEHKRFEGLPGPIPLDEYRSQLVGIVNMLA